MLSRKEADGWQLAVFSDLGNLPVHPVAARARIMVVSVPHRCGQRAHGYRVCDRRAFIAGLCSRANFRCGFVIRRTRLAVVCYVYGVAAVESLVVGSGRVGTDRHDRF